MAQKNITLGGQAVIEGVLIKTTNNYAIAVRLPNRKICVKRFLCRSWTKKNLFLSLPILRGFVVLLETLVIGFRALTYSANQAESKKEELSISELFFTLAFSLLFVILLFKLLPLWLAGLLQQREGLGHVAFTFLDGVIKIALFLLYLGLISNMKEVRRLFEYHGAEHMAVHCYEKRKKLTIENVTQYPPEHPRCGTAFILLVFMISILVYMFIPSTYPLLHKLTWRVALLPVIAGVSFEVLKLSSRSLAFLSWPGLCLQKLTTRKPNRKQIEVAIRALQSAVR